MCENAFPVFYTATSDWVNSHLLHSCRSEWEYLQSLQRSFSFCGQWRSFNRFIVDAILEIVFSCYENNLLLKVGFLSTKWPFLVWNKEWGNCGWVRGHPALKKFSWFFPRLFSLHKNLLHFNGFHCEWVWHCLQCIFGVLNTLNRRFSIMSCPCMVYLQNKICDWECRKYTTFFVVLPRLKAQFTMYFLVCKKKAGRL